MGAAAWPAAVSLADAVDAVSRCTDAGLQVGVLLALVTVASALPSALDLSRRWRGRGETDGRSRGESAAPGADGAAKPRLDLSQGHIGTYEGAEDFGRVLTLELLSSSGPEWRAVVSFDVVDGLPDSVAFWSRPSLADDWSLCRGDVPAWLVIQAAGLARQVF